MPGDSLEPCGQLRRDKALAREERTFEGSTRKGKRKLLAGRFMPHSLKKRRLKTASTEKRGRSAVRCFPKKREKRGGRHTFLKAHRPTWGREEGDRGWTLAGEG